MNIQKILPEYIREAMEWYEKDFFESLSSASTSISKAVDQLHRSSGKGVRPIILLLVASTLEPLTYKHVNGAVFIELLHVATLIHDDIIDDSEMRRGVPSLKAEIGSHKAVLMGDFVLSTSMQKATETNNLRILNLLTRLGRDLAEGEFLQMDTAEAGLPTLEAYYEVIRCKTASLMTTSVEVGALLAGITDERLLAALHEAGNQLGLAFQIKDDILDYISTANVMGKPVGSDLREHKVTLPLLLALQSAPQAEAEPLRTLLASGRTLTDPEVHTLIDFAIKYRGIEAAQREVDRLIGESKRLFVEHLTAGSSLEVLLQLCDYIGSREK